MSSSLLVGKRRMSSSLLVGKKEDVIKFVGW